MGNGYNHHHHLQQSFYTKNSILPILCRVSIKDVKLRDFKDRSSSFSDDPTSPKVSCMGQVKRNSKLIGFPTPYRLTSSTSTSTCTSTSASTSTSNSTSTSTAVVTTSRNHSTHGNFKYTKLKRLFSGRNLLPSNTAATAACTAVCSGRGICRNGSRRSSKINHDDGGGGNSHVQHVEEVNISELDPPLPVVKKVQPPPEVNLWKRRSGGMTLKSLQIEQIHQIPNNKFLPVPTV